MYVQSIAIDGKAQTPDHTTLGQTGDTATVAVPAKRVPFFKAGKELREIVNK